MAQKSGKTTKIDLYKFISPKGQVKDDSEGAAVGYALGSKTVQGVNSLGNTLNGISVVVTEIRDALLENSAATDKMLQGLVPKRKDNNVTPAKKKKRSGLTDFVVPVVAGFFESLAKLAGFLFRTLVARGILKWLSDPKNLKKIEAIWNGIKSVAEFLYNFFSGAIFGMLDGIAKMWDPEASWWEKIVGFGQFFLGLGTLLLGLRWLSNPMKLVNDVIWVLKTLWTNLTNSKKRMKKGKWGRILGAATTVAAVTTAGVITYQAVQAMPEGSKPNPSPTPENDTNTKPGGGVSLNSEHVIIAAGTNDWNDPKVGARGVGDAINNVKEMGYKPVFIPPANQDRYKPVHLATTKAAQEAGAIIEQGQYDPKDPLHPYTHIMPSSMKSIQEKYNGAAVIGDSNAENAASPRYPHRGKSATVVAGAIKSKLKPRAKDKSKPKKDVPERAAGGWISGPQSGYPVSLTGKGVDFIGHGTEYVAPKKSGGGFVVPFNTPATKTNPGLTGRRMREASTKGFDLGGMFNGFSAGGVTVNNIFNGFAKGGFAGIHNIADAMNGYAAGGQVSKNARALLNTIRFAEGTSGSNGYKTWFGGRTDLDITNMTINEVVAEQKKRLRNGEATYGRYTSAAVGAYQMMTPEVFARKAGIDPATAKFTPENQDKMAVVGYMMGQAKMSQAEIDAPINKAQIAKMAPVWASLPMMNGRSRYGQPVKSFDKLKKVYEQALGGKVEGPDSTTLDAPADGSSIPSSSVADAAGAAVDPEAQKKLAFDMLAKSIDETRSVLGVTSETAEEQEKAVKTVKEEEENKVTAATKVATAASKQSASTPPPPPPPPQTITIPDLKIPDYISYLPKLGLFGGSA